MNGSTQYERFWGSLAHVPIITIIWLSYLGYRYCSGHPFNLLELPITPVVLTLCSIPISLSIMRLQKTSQFVCSNAQEAYFFNVWLLKVYFTLFVIGALGIWCTYSYVIKSAQIIGGAVSFFCFIQSSRGIITSLKGNIYCYWYPGKKN